MKNIMKKLMILMVIVQTSYANKVIYNNNLDNVRGKKVYNELDIIEPSVSPYIVEMRKFDIKAQSDDKCPIRNGRTSEHCRKVYNHFKQANKTNIDAKVEYGTSRFTDEYLVDDMVKDMVGFINHSYAKTTHTDSQLIGLNTHQRVSEELHRVNDGEQTFYTLTGNQSNAILNFRGMANDEDYVHQDVFKFNAMNELMQKRYRSENIYITSKSERKMPFNHSFYLRGTTVGTEKDYYGTSFSSPTVMAYATNVAAKFPNLSLHQIKQIILTTATPVDNSGYLHNKFGWGYVNETKAMNGPSQFNAGLLDEEALFAGNVDKIYDNKGNTYFYADIPTNQTYIFSNDITSGLNGNSYTGAKNKRTYKTFVIRNLYGSSAFKKALNLDKDTKHLFDNGVNNLHVTDVIPSEYRMYADRANAGLRKAGNGTLRLTGKQLYNAPTQVLEGTLILENKSNSTYEIVEGANMIIKGDNIHIKELRIAGNVVIDGKNITIDNVIKTPTGKLTIKNSSRNVIMKNITAHKLNTKTLHNERFTIQNVNIRNVEFDNIIINPNKTFVLPETDLRDWNNDLDIIGTKLKDLKGIEKFNLLQYDDKTGKFEELALNVDKLAYERYLQLKASGFYKTKDAKRPVSYYDVMFNNLLIIEDLRNGY